MKNKLFLLSFVLFSISRAQTTINFSYDNAGNTVLRSIQVTQMGARFTPPATKKGDDLVSIKRDSTIQFKVYPNPASTIINVEGILPSNVNTAKLVLLNDGGQVVKSDVYDGTLKTLSVNELMEGVYLLQIIYGEKAQVAYKIVINK